MRHFPILPRKPLIKSLLLAVLVGALSACNASSTDSDNNSDTQGTKDNDSASDTRPDPDGPLRAYFKASNADWGDTFGWDVSLSGDGSTLAVGAPAEESDAAGINQAQDNNQGFGSGAVYLFTETDDGWQQQAYVKASNPGTDDAFGKTLALSQDGSSLAVGAPQESSDASGVNPTLDEDVLTNSGAVYVFTRAPDDSWSQQAHIKADNAGLQDQFGHDLALADDGNTLAVGAPHESNSNTGINPADDNELTSGGHSAKVGAAYVFTRSSGTWSQDAYIKASNAERNDVFGESLALSGDGATLAVGARGENSQATGIDGDETDNSAASSGAAYVFSRAGNNWSQQAYVKASNTDAQDHFGRNLALSRSGDTLAISAEGEASAARGIDGDETDNSADGSGAVYLLTRSGSLWQQQAYIKASNSDASDQFGHSLDLSADGNTLVAGAHYESSKATGLNGDEADNSRDAENRTWSAGAAYVFARQGTNWQQTTYVKASNTAKSYQFAYSLALDDAGDRMAFGSNRENGKSTGINGDQAANLGQQHSGAVYLY